MRDSSHMHGSRQDARFRVGEEPDAVGRDGFDRPLDAGNEHEKDLADFGRGGDGEGRHAEEEALVESLIPRMVL